MSEMVNVLIIEQNAAVREGLAAFLNAQPSMTVVGQLVNGSDALAVMDALMPDVILLDVHQQLYALDTIKALKKSYPQSHLVFISPGYDVHSLWAALYVGASGYLPQTVVTKKLTKLIRKLVSQNEQSASADE